MKNQIKFKSIKKAEFEAKMIAAYGSTGLTASRYSEFDPAKGKDVPLTLYYFNDVHVGTFCKSGSTWMYEKEAA